ncbi:hypothetical protein GCM10009841_10950 [Microlunatus panaciterrae]|jgi:hypothetical protein|uniref:Integral membrane protein n=1 Tax=Microlunatus panaciterrae TaxID=400768 RepID=A0ABS2RKX4_9ACTN|nr:hypothetical protein [Microlunatus panaciterrae]MBM7799652.1 hypothetical protein [Microlunatus panaciterrae]
MEIVQQILVLVHLVGFASLFGGFLVQMRTAHPEVNPAMLHGALTQLASGLVLVVLLEVGDEPVNHVKIGIKLLVTLAITVLVVKNRKFESIPRGLWALLGALTLLNAALAVLWK